MVQTRAVHVFIDDSGDGGFKVGQGSTSHLVMAACVFRDPKQIELLADAVRACSSKNRVDSEFKYAKTKDRIRSCFFDCTAHIQYDVRAIIMTEEWIWSPRYRSSPSKFKSFTIGQLLSHGFGQIHDAKVFIDGQDTKAFGISDAEHVAGIANRPSPGTIAQVRFVDSKANVGIQLADMVAGAINRGVRTHSKPDTRHLDRIRSRTFQPRGSYWFFK